MENENEILKSSVESERLKYSAPKLVEYGSVADMIKAGPIPVAFDADSAFQPGPT